MEWPMGLHVMGGASVWSFGWIPDEEGDLYESRSGYLVAADFGARVGESITVGVGGWYNRTGEYSIEGRSSLSVQLSQPDLVHSFQRTTYSVYGSIFYDMFGVQAGIVPVHLSQTTTVKATGASASDDDGGQVDLTLYGIVRLAADDDNPISAAVGLGLQRLGARDANAGTGIVPASPSSTEFSGFFTLSWEFWRGMSADFSGWYTTSAPELSGMDVPNPSQTRATIGLGYQF
jgi:hypothetical protein